MSEATLKRIDYLSPITWIVWIFTAPIKIFTWIVVKIRVYDPEKTLCPACGFKGDSGTNRKSCSVMCVKTNDVAKYALRHICFRCSANFFAPVLTKPDKWAAKEVIQ